MIKPLASTALLALALNLSACSTFDFDIGPSGEESVSTEAAAINALRAGFSASKPMARLPRIGALFSLTRVWMN